MEALRPQRTEVSRSTGAEKNSISEALSGCFPTNAVNSAALKHRRYWPFPARKLGLRIVAIEESGGGLETEIQRSPFSALFVGRSLKVHLWQSLAIPP
jgi:hypothetical protein